MSFNVNLFYFIFTVIFIKFMINLKWKFERKLGEHEITYNIKLIF